ncbi:MAG: glucokinase, partial [Pontixanthobacter sp.]
VAAPTSGDTIRFTTNPWTIHPAEVNRRCGLHDHVVVNDLEAIAHGVAYLATDPDTAPFDRLAGPPWQPVAGGRIGVIGVGTGLGAATIDRPGPGTPGGSPRISATEAGHIGFAPVDAVDDAILRKLRERHGRVSVERVVAGPAITDIYHTLAAKEGDTDVEAQQSVTDVALWARGLDPAGEDRRARAAVERFCLTLGSVAGDIALAQGAFAGIVIAGGLGRRLGEVLPTSGFAERFTAKGRFRGVMETVPVVLLVHAEPGLLGAAAAYREHSAGGERSDR